MISLYRFGRKLKYGLSYIGTFRIQELANGEFLDQVRASGDGCGRGGLYNVHCTCYVTYLTSPSEYLSFVGLVLQGPWLHPKFEYAQRACALPAAAAPTT